MKPGEVGRQVFTEDGGTIGRAATNAWVLTHNKVSARHAEISFRSGVFYIAGHEPERRVDQFARQPAGARSAVCAEVWRPHLHRAVRDRRVDREPAAERPDDCVQPIDDPFGQDDPFALAAWTPARAFEPRAASGGRRRGRSAQVLRAASGPTAPRDRRSRLCRRPTTGSGSITCRRRRSPIPCVPPTPSAVRAGQVRSVGIPADYNPLHDSGIGPVAPELPAPASQSSRLDVRSRRRG